LLSLQRHVVGCGGYVIIREAKAAVRIWCGKLSVGVVLSQLERFLGPIGWAASLPLRLLILGYMPDQVGGDRFGIRSKLVDELRVPEMVKAAGFEAGGRDLPIVATPVTVVRTVQRLIQISDEV
jgi:hypothetical protein